MAPVFFFILCVCVFFTFNFSVPFFSFDFLSMHRSPPRFFSAFFFRFFPECLRFFYVGLFFKPWHVYTSTYNVRARLFLNLLVLVKSQKQHTQLLELACCRASTTAQHSTAQHSAISHAQSSDARMYVPNRVRQRITCRTEYDNAGKQTELARASMASSIYLQLAVFSKPKKKSKSTRPKKCTTTSS